MSDGLKDSTACSQGEVCTNPHEMSSNKDTHTKRLARLVLSTMGVTAIAVQNHSIIYSSISFAIIIIRFSIKGRHENIPSN